MQANTSLRTGGAIWLLLSIVVIALDQLSKAIVLRVLEPYVPHAVVPGLLNWTLAFNTGAAFSFLADQQGWQRAQQQHQRQREERRQKFTAKEAAFRKQKSQREPQRRDHDGGDANDEDGQLE